MQFLGISHFLLGHYETAALIFRERLLMARDTDIRHVILQCSAVNEIDLSALESLETINERLKEMDVTLHLSEVKGPVMDRLKAEHFLETLTGRVFLSQYQAVRAIQQNGSATPNAARLSASV